MQAYSDRLDLSHKRVYLVLSSPLIGALSSDRVTHLFSTVYLYPVKVKILMLANGKVAFIYHTNSPLGISSQGTLIISGHRVGSLTTRVTTKNP
jgi:hypothetical protein